MLQVSVEHVSIAYERTTVLKDISFSVEEGDYICVLGENGSGKSTLLKGILGLVPLQEGTVSFHGETERTHVGYLPQQTQTQKDFPASVMEVVLSGCLNSKGKRPFYLRKERETALYNLKRLGIGELKKKSYRNLSGGQQQRVLLARALCATDKIIFLDEPISGLDPVATSEFYQLIEQLNKENHISVVMVSHDVGTALKSANKVLHITREGCFFGSKEEYLQSGLGAEFLHAWNGGETK
ncbi:MAG: ABC transporter ATP-binding protein [Lachnospiraceae bacterium]|nr:ABC transporter ATP-binding protein [Lachnospiraceae bacterium]